MPKTWNEKLAGGKVPHVVVLDKPFAGVPAGARLFIASPCLLNERIRDVPAGTSIDPVALRAELATRHGADATCPVSTAIFLRIVAEAALEEIAKGRPPAEVTPFWRVIAPGSSIAGKLSCGDDFISIMRSMESQAA